MYASIVYASNPAATLALTFDVVGVWRKNMLLQDRQTGSLWQQATGQALAGPLAGQHLQALYAEESTWGQVRVDWPHAEYATPPARRTGLIPTALLMRMLRITHHLEASGLTQPDQRLDGHTVVIGVTINGLARAYPLETLKAQRHIADSLGEQTIHLTYDAAADRVHVRCGNDNMLRYERQWWLGWSEFHPRSDIYVLSHLGYNQP